MRSECVCWARVKRGRLRVSGRSPSHSIPDPVLKAWCMSALAMNCIYYARIVIKRQVPVSCCACTTHINNVIFGIYKKNVLMQSCRFINSRVWFQAHVCTSALRACAYVSAAGWTQTLLGIECFHLSLTGLRLGVSTPFPGHLLPAPTVCLSTNRGAPVALQMGRWCPAIGRQRQGPESEDWGLRIFRNLPTSPMAFSGQHLLPITVSPEILPPSAAHFSRAPAGERFLGFS